MILSRPIFFSSGLVENPRRTSTAHMAKQAGNDPNNGPVTRKLGKSFLRELLKILTPKINDAFIIY